MRPAPRTARRRAGLGRPAESGDAVARAAAESELLRLHRDAQGQDAGVVRPDRARAALPEAFHLYSMRQAIEEGFILDVLKNYTTYATYYRLVKAVEDDPNLPKKKATRALAKFMSLHPHNIEQKTEVMVEHFRRSVRSRLGGRAKAMVVTSSRLHAVRYKLAFERYIARERLHRHPAAGRFQRHGQGPGHRPRIHRARHEHGCVTGKPISEEQLPERFRIAGLSSAAGGEQIPDRLRSAVAAGHVRGQATRRRAGGANTVAPEPEDSRQGGAVRPGLRQ